MGLNRVYLRNRKMNLILREIIYNNVIYLQTWLHNFATQLYNLMANSIGFMMLLRMETVLTVHFLYTFLLTRISTMKLKILFQNILINIAFNIKNMATQIISYKMWKGITGSLCSRKYRWHVTQQCSQYMSTAIKFLVPKDC